MAADFHSSGTRNLAPSDRLTSIYVAGDGSGVTANEDGDILRHDDLLSALELSGWTYTGRPTRQ